MSLERFKTQILLLHSEQSTLDKLSTGFGDRYTVHCATSGSEALSTLGQTSIDVIVTAQVLPGMSGLDALREAKKRSPETIGILLAGNDGEGVEALVGDREVFQVVRGGVTAETLRTIIDNATRQSRLMALAQSANDTTAYMDEPTGEHIVMETAENGAPIITDVTGRMPILNPDKVSAQANVGARAVDVLVLTKDEEFLVTVRESTRGIHNIIYANTLAQADDAVRKHKVGVAVIDAAMVGDNVEKLTLHLRTTAPRLVAIVAGRRDDGEMLMDLINRGKVYRFLLKPVSPGRARLAIEASVKHHLEAPDAAFRSIGAAAETKAAPRPAPAVTPAAEPKAAAPKPAPKVASSTKPQAKPAPKPTPKPAAKITAEPPKPSQSQTVPVIKVEPRRAPDNSGSLMSDALGDAFGGDDKSFTETMTDIARTVGSTFASVTSRKSTSAPEAVVPPAPALAVGSASSTFPSAKLLGIGAVGIVVALGLGWWLFGGSNQPVPSKEPISGTPRVTEANPVLDSPSGSGSGEANLDELLSDARLAVSAGQIFNPPGSNAIEFYLAAATAAPANETITTELNDAIAQALSMAESALLAKNTLDAEAALQRVSLADADNARLPFLNAQLVQIQLRNFVDSARLAIRDGRFEDASAALNGARALNSGDGTELAMLANELSAAQSAQRVDDVLARATMRLDEGKLTAPSNDNARYYFELALSNDPGNSAARQGLNVVASKLVLQARTEIDAGNFDNAENLLADARRLDPGSNELNSATAVLSTARNREAEAIRAQQQRAAAEKAAAERAAAEKAAAEKAAAEKAAAEKAAAERAAAEKLAAEKAAADTLAAEQRAAEQAAAAAAIAAASEVAGEDSIENEDTAATTVAESDATAATGANSSIDESRPVAVSSLVRTKYVGPKYPRAAQRRGTSGWVDVVFTVDIDGSVSNVSVRDSEPGITFVDSAVSAVEAWEFEPVIENGVAVQKRAAVRMMFAVE
ncbi:MAG: TonB family protein [Gammaproteobacteria bacterium]|nr:TonB family protein [Gammaproteobacteria bacterium]MDH5302718.1 TonB family protein [Gammaproteobacteria bacterium]MDH5321893.1 TonB family protein [Gammaproteobacteria bacterium]